MSGKMENAFFVWNNSGARALVLRTKAKQADMKRNFRRFAEVLGNLEKNRKRFVAQALDASFAVLALAAANILRLSTVNFEELWPAYLLIPAATVFIFRQVGVYDAVIRFSGIDETALAKSVVLSSLLLLVTLYLLNPDPNPRSLFVIFGLLLLVFCVGARHLWKAIAADRLSGTGEPIAIYGAGALGRQVVQICNNGSDFRPVLWLDDDAKLHGRTLAGAPVLDPKDSRTPAVLKAKNVDTILMAIPSVGGSMKELLESLRNFDCRVQTLPSIDDIMANRVTSRDARTLPLEELIGRKQVAPDATLMSKNITGKAVLVTGAGGSVGGELCRQILPLNPSVLVLLDVSEAALYTVESDLVALKELSDNRTPVICVLGNVVFKSDVAHVLKTYGIQSLFHAAAYKHVPMVESNPQPAIRTNVFGSLATLEASIENGVENFLLISTDKAVRPTNVMGATKRLAEMVVQARAAQGGTTTALSMVRFGNVIGSSGSVVPKFSEQIESGGPLTVTHKDIVRYFMSIPEAAQLVIQASALAKGGDVFLLDMGKPVQIADLAKSLIYLHGKTLKDEDNPKGEIEILYTGLREGEKLFEELLIDDDAVATQHPKISRGIEDFIEWPELRKVLDLLAADMASNPKDQMIRQLQSAVKGYSPNRSPEKLEDLVPSD